MIETVTNKRRTGPKPGLSVLIPNYEDDPSALLSDLLAQAEHAPIEILIYDDGTGDSELNTRLVAKAKNHDTTVVLYFADKNKGRSAARNHLMQNARADWVLFLDADMRPQSVNFLTDYLTLIKQGNADILFGGFTVPGERQSSETELHRAYSQTSDCLTAAERTINGPQYVASSNLCVRKQVLLDEPFDTGFSGWGWEDSEWAARVAKHHTLKHIDNPALHLGLENTETLLKRFQSSGSNYIRFTRAHPELAKSLTLYRTSRRLMAFPGQKLMRPALAFLVRRSFTPTKLRLLALKLWRASWYAEAFKAEKLQCT